MHHLPARNPSHSDPRRGFRRIELTDETFIFPISMSTSTKNRTENRDNYRGAGQQVRN